MIAVTIKLVHRVALIINSQEPPVYRAHFGVHKLTEKLTEKLKLFIRLFFANWCVLTRSSSWSTRSHHMRTRYANQLERPSQQRLPRRSPWLAKWLSSFSSIDSERETALMTSLAMIYDRPNLILSAALLYFLPRSPPKQHAKRSPRKVFPFEKKVKFVFSLY